MTITKHILNLRSRTVAQGYPYRLRRRTLKEAQLMKIFIFRHEHMPVFASVLPYIVVIRLRHSDISDVHGFRIQILQPFNQFEREVLIEQ